MAIKGKRKAKPRQPVRAPRRELVPVPVPFARRRGVQVIAAFVAGLMVFWGGIWLTNGLREQRNTERAKDEGLTRRRAGAAWETLIETELAKIGTIQAGQPPVVLPQVRATISGLDRKTLEGSVATLRTSAADAKEATTAVANFDLSRTLADKGFDKGAVLRFLSARDELVTSLSLYREAALVAMVGAGLERGDRAAALERARSLLSLADSALTRFQTHQMEALAAAGILRLPQQPTVPGLPAS